VSRIGCHQHGLQVRLVDEERERPRDNTGYYKPWTGIQLCENCPAFK
jgi:hypothetical protein